MIVVVDEQFYMAEPFWRELELCGYKVLGLETADAGYETLQVADPNDLELVIVDLMLACEPSGRFASQTDSYLDVGWLLLQELTAANPTVFPSRALLWTASRRDWTGALEAARCAGVSLLRKSSVTDPRNFANLVHTRVRALAGLDS